MEDRANYAGVGIPQTIEAFRNRRCSLLFADFNYEPPTPEEVKALIAVAEWSQTQVSEIVGVSHNAKGSTTIRKWRSPIESPEHRKIPYAAWRLMLIHAGVVTL